MAASDDERAAWPNGPFSTDSWLKLTDGELAQLSEELIALSGPLADSASRRRRNARPCSCSPTAPRAGHDSPGRRPAARRCPALWLGETVSELGTAVSSLAIPLVAVVTLHAGAFATGVLIAAAWLPWVVIGLPAGAWVDRLPARRVMIAADVVSVLAFASVPVAAWLGVLTPTAARLRAARRLRGGLLPDLVPRAASLDAAVG